MNTRTLLVLTLSLGLLAPTAAAAPLAGPCVAGGGYNSACDANQDGSITVTDIQLTAGHWNQTGTFVSDSNHTHLGQTWTGSNNPLVLQGSYGSPSWAPLALSNSIGAAVRVNAAGGSGVWVESALLNGVLVDAAGGDGVFVCRTGSASTCTPSSSSNGIEIGYAQDYGLYLQRSGFSGLVVTQAGSSALWVSLAGAHGVYVGTAGNDGVHVDYAGYDGVYANTTQATHEWGFYTPDKIYAGTALASNGPVMLVAQSGDDGSLETGDVVVVSGTGTVLGESESPPPLVRKAAAGDGSVMGVVYRRFVAEEKIKEAAGEDQGERRTYLHTRSTDGPVASGDTLLVVVLGPIQVKAAGDSTITAGIRLTAAAAGGVRPLQTRTVEGMLVSEGAPVIGTAMGPAQDGLVWVLVNPQ